MEWNLFFHTGANNKTTTITTTSEVSSQVLDVGKFLVETLTDNLNLFKLLQYIEESKLAHKVGTVLVAILLAILLD